MISNGRFRKTMYDPKRYPIWTQSLWGAISTLQMGHALGSATWPTANLAILFPIRVPVQQPVSQIFWLNGAAVSGNVDAGIYTMDGTRIYSTGSTAQSGISSIQTVSFTEITLGPASYYLALSVNNTTATIQRITATLGAFVPQVIGLAEVASSFALPATLTLASATNNYIPAVGIASGYTI